MVAKVSFSIAGVEKAWLIIAVVGHKFFAPWFVKESHTNFKAPKIEPPDLQGEDCKLFYSRLFNEEWGNRSVNIAF